MPIVYSSNLKAIYSSDTFFGEITLAEILLNDFLFDFTTYDYEVLFDFENVYDGYLYTRKGKRDKACVKKFELNALENTVGIHEDLINRTYELDPYNDFYVYEPKKRLIKAPSFRDRVMQRTLCKSVLEPVVEKHLIYDTYACRTGKGTHRGLYRLEDFLKRYYRKNGRDGYIIKGDISKYFYSISHDILKNNLYPLTRPYDIEWLLDKIIDSTENPGLPLGNQSSQWFANFYLSSFDHFVKEVLGIKYYIRYMDDFVAIVETKEQAKFILELMEKYLWEELRLKTNQKTQYFPIKNGIDFLGFHTYISESGKVYRKIRKDSKERIKKKLKRLKILYQEGKVSETTIKLIYDSWRGHAEHGDTHGLFWVTDKLYADIFI